MTAAAFQKHFPKPWHFVKNSVGFSLRAANHAVIGTLNLSAHHSGTPQQEWNRHVAAVMQEYLPVTEPETTIFPTKRDSEPCSPHFLSS